MPQRTAYRPATRFCMHCAEPHARLSDPLLAKIDTRTPPPGLPRPPRSQTGPWERRRQQQQRVILCRGSGSGLCSTRVCHVAGPAWPQARGAFATGRLLRVNTEQPACSTWENCGAGTAAWGGRRRGLRASLPTSHAANAFAALEF